MAKKAAQSSVKHTEKLDKSASQPLVDQVAPAPTEKPADPTQIITKKGENGLRTWHFDGRVFQQTKPLSKRFLRRGDVFDLDSLDGFRLLKLARDKHFTHVQEVKAAAAE